MLETGGLNLDEAIVRCRASDRRSDVQSVRLDCDTEKIEKSVSSTAYRGFKEKAEVMRKKDERNVALRQEWPCFMVLAALGGLLVLALRPVICLGLEDFFPGRAGMLA